MRSLFWFGGVSAALVAVSNAVSCSHELTWEQPWCEDADVLNIHCVSHTHDDTGWLKTVDEYYMGLNNSLQDAGVQYILDSVIERLNENPKRRFIYVEIAFFMRWWRQQSPEVRELTKTLVEQRRLEFINGGWCMNDEAATHYQSIIDQMELGHRFIGENFGQSAAPRIGWHIDPFGHSATNAELFSKMGFDAFYFGRIDYQDAALRTEQKRANMMWRPSPSMGATAQIFSGWTDGYGPPANFCFDANSCADTTPVQDDPRLEDYNADALAALFIKESDERHSWFRSNNIMFTMGSDFQYENANVWFKNLDKLMNAVSSNPAYDKYNVFYSTPSIYTDAVNAANLTWDVKTDDFFPYADAPHAFWSGYFTSRPALKGYVRKTNAYLQVAKQVGSFVGAGIDDDGILVLSRAQGVTQHHDAVSGTSKQHVADDYAKLLHNGTHASGMLIAQALQTLGAGTDQFSFCTLANVSICHAASQPLAAGKDVTSVVYNPLAWPRTEFLRVPVAEGLAYTVTDLTSGKIVPSQLTTDSNPNPNLLIGSYYAPTSAILRFQASVPALGLATFKISSAKAPKPIEEKFRADENAGDAGLELKNAYLQAAFDADGNLQSITNLASDTTVQIEQQWAWYNSSVSLPSTGSQASGAYIFRPTPAGAMPFDFDFRAVTSDLSNPLVNEVTQTYYLKGYDAVGNPDHVIRSTWRLFEDAEYLEHEFDVGPIPIKPHNWGKEIITRYATKGLTTQKTWFSDSNGREMRERRYNYRKTWNFTTVQPTAGNFFPVNSAASIKSDDGSTQLTVLTDRSQAGASLIAGAVELMVHRRLTHDDGRGVGEALNETVDGSAGPGRGLVIRGVHRLFVDTPSNSARLHRKGAQEFAHPLHPSYTSDAAAKAVSFSALASESIAAQLNLLTVLRTSPTEVLVRVEHMYEQTDNEKLSMPASIDLGSTFTTFKVTGMTELTLSANQPLMAYKEKSWKTDPAPEPTKCEYGKPPVGLTVQLCPMEIRTFSLTTSVRDPSPIELM